MNIILSLTTTFERSNFLFYSLQSIFKQSYKPDLILLNISKESYLYDTGFIQFPSWLEKFDLKINWVKNIGSYRKLLPAINFASDNDIIVTADDDILYHEDWLKHLVKSSNLETDAIVCCRARYIKKNIFNNWQNYSNWDLVLKKTKGTDILPTGCAGVVYRKRLLDLEFLTDSNFLEIAPTTDDLWFRMASLRKQTPVAVFPEIDHRNIYLSHRLGLEDKNLFKFKKDNSALIRLYNRWKFKIINYIGINFANNDIAWDAICTYSQVSNRKWLSC